MKCPICVEVYTKILRKKITCQYCDYEACSTCTQQYVLSTPEAPHCMNCRKSWSRHFMSEMFTAKFMNSEYKTYRENVLFDLEKALMPSTMDEVVYVKNAREINMEIARNVGMIGALDIELRHIIPENIEQKELECNIRRQIFDLKLKNEVLQFKISNRLVKPTERRVFTKKCPVQDCQGYLSMRWKCEICERYTCADCHELKDENHVCKPENIESVKLLKKETKPCPSCTATIYKTEGCDQMFCTACTTAFSWRTGRIETGRIHNPHYYEYQRQRGGLAREIGDIQCGGMPDIYTIRRGVKLPIEIQTLHRNIQHFELVEMNRYRNLNITNPNKNLQYRIRFMLNEMSERDFKQKIQQVDKDLNKRLEIGQVATTFIQVMTDLFIRLVSDKNITAFNSEYAEAAQYFNTLFRQISKSYNCSVPLIENYQIAFFKY